MLERIYTSLFRQAAAKECDFLLLLRLEIHQFITIE